MLVRRSLGLRLLLGAAVLILLAVGVTGLVLSALFHDQVRAQYDSELVIHLNQLTSLLELDEGGQVRLRGEPSDPRFHSAYGGRYWQVEREAQRTLRSRSLWDQVLALPDDSPAPGELDRHLIRLPEISETCFPSPGTGGDWDGERDGASCLGTGGAQPAQAGPAPGNRQRT